jgi:ribosomal protein S7
MRDTKVIENFLKNNYKKLKEMSLFRNLKKEVETGANGTQDYIIKKGENTGKIAKK